jgi:hypothetical protein
LVILISRISILLGVLILVIGLTASASAADGDTLNVTFAAQNDSGLTGTATLVEKDGKTTVSVALAGAAIATEMPSHIHVGTCDNLDPAPKYPLNNIVDGKSETTVDASIATLLASPFAINVHKSATDIATYVACANLVASSAGSQVMPNTGQPADGTSYLLPIAGVVLIIMGAGFAVLRRTA